MTIIVQKKNHGSSGGGLDAKSYSDSCDPMNCAYQAPLSMGFSRQEYWSGVPFPSPGDVPDDLSNKL